MKFTDLMNNPLKSKNRATSAVNESSELTLQDIEKELEEGLEDVDGVPSNGSIPEAEGEDDSISTDDIKDIVDSSETDEIEDMTDYELAALDAELGGEELDNFIDDKEDEVTLSPEEEIEADDMMKIAATSALINDEMSTEEKCEFVKCESEVTTAINEGFLNESDVNELATQIGVTTEAQNNYTQKMIIRLDAASKKKQLHAIAVNVSAAAHNDPDYIRYKKIMKAKKIIRKKLEKKYDAEATKRMKVYFARLKKSKSSNLAKIANKYSK